MNYDLPIDFLVILNGSHLDLLSMLTSRVLPGLILLFGVVWFVPFTKNSYGKRYFDWPHNEPESTIFRFVVLAILSVLLSSLAWPSETFGVAAGALLLVSFYGVVRLDGKFHIIPDRFQLTGTAAASYLFFAERGVTMEVLVAFALALLPAVSLWAFSAIYSKVRQKEGLGFGDIKMLGWLSILFGQELFTLLFLAALFLLLRSLPRFVLRRANLESTFAFGPYLVIASLVLLATS